MRLERVVTIFLLVDAAHPTRFWPLKPAEERTTIYFPFARPMGYAKEDELIQES